MKRSATVIVLFLITVGVFFGLGNALASSGQVHRPTFNPSAVLDTSQVVDLRSPDAADVRAFELCMVAYGNRNHCTADVFAYLSIDADAVSEDAVNELIAEGWYGIPDDRREALYPPFTRS